MAFHVRDNFKEKGPVSQVPASWYNKVASFLNNLVQGYGIILNKNESGASVISVDPSVISGGSGSVSSVDGHAPDGSGAVSFGLTASRIVKTDANGHLVTLGGNLATTSLTIVTNVAWTGTALRKTTRALTLENGVITAIGAESTTNIDTAVTYTP